MGAEQLAAELRPRGAWESVDFGVALLRACVAPAALGWLALAAPLYGLAWTLAWETPALAMGALWLVKPLLDRVPLWVLGRTLFGARPTLAQTLRQAPALLLRAPLAELLWWRLTPARVAHSAVTLLEGLRGGLLRQRWRDLAPGLGGPTLGLAFLCGALRLWLVPMLGVSVLLVLPERVFPTAWEDLDALFEPGAPAFTWALWALADGLSWATAELLFVAGSFGLYVQRRTELEGWDIQQRFQRLARRLTQAGRFGLALVLLGLSAASARAQDPAAPRDSAPPELPVIPDGPLPTPQGPAEVAGQILADPEFGGSRTVTRWKVREWDRPAGCERERTPRAPLQVGASCPSGVLYALVAALVVAVLWAILRRVDLRPPTQAPEEGPARASGMLPPQEVRAPEAVRTARARWAAGDPVGAVAALYSGAVDRLVERGLPLGRGQTEGEVLRLTRRRRPSPEAEALGHITRSWLLAAYAHHALDEAEFEALVHSWQLGFGEGP